MRVNAALDEDRVEALGGGAEHIRDQRIADHQHRVARRMAGQPEGIFVDTGMRFSIPCDAATQAS